MNMQIINDTMVELPLTRRDDGDGHEGLGDAQRLPDGVAADSVPRAA